MRLPVLSAILPVVALLASGQQGAGNLQGPAPPAATAGSTAAPKGNPQPPKSDTDITQRYIIGPQDIISIFVYNEPTFTALNQTVRPDGIVSMPLLGELKASGKAPSELQDEISKTLAEKFLRYTPRVEVRVDKVNSVYYSINGAVNKSGQYPLLVPTTIMQALVNAGGFHDFADLKHIKLLRNGVVIETFNWYDAVKGKHLEKNVYLKHGDLIIVKE